MAEASAYGAVVGRPRGPALIRRRLEALHAGGAPAGGTVSQPDNAQAIAANRKAGFRITDGPVDTPWARSVLMRRDRTRQVPLAENPRGVQTPRSSWDRWATALRGGLTMYTKGEVRYEPLPLPDRVQLPEAQAQAAAEAHLVYMRKRHSVRAYATTPVPQALIETCIAAAGTAPSGANHQPWHFAAIAEPALKARIREAAEAEERDFYAGGAGDEWLAALEPIGTGVAKPHLTDAPWLIVVFAQRWGITQDGRRYKNYYVPESVGIATGFLISALHHAGLVCLEHTPNPMKFLTGLLGRPDSEKPVMILPVGYPAADATVPAVAKRKKPLPDILSVFA
jgi:nitroreductase